MPVKLLDRAAKEEKARAEEAKVVRFLGWCSYSPHLPELPDKAGMVSGEEKAAAARAGMV